MELALEIQQEKIPACSLGIWWLGMAGFAIKTANGRIALVDPYLSDFVPDPPGWQRRHPGPLKAEEAVADLILFTHDDFDHFDLKSLPILANHLIGMEFAGPRVCCQVLQSLGIGEERIHPVDQEETANVKSFHIQGVFAIHTPGCTGLIIDCSPGRIYAVGDTIWDDRLLKGKGNLDIVLVPITPSDMDNLTLPEAARLVAMLKPRYAIPCHYGTFDVFTEDPEGFVFALSKLQNESEVVILTPGQKAILEVE